MLAQNPSSSIQLASTISAWRHCHLTSYPSHHQSSPRGIDYGIVLAASPRPYSHGDPIILLRTPTRPRSLQTRHSFSLLFQYRQANRPSFSESFLHRHPSYTNLASPVPLTMAFPTGRSISSRNRSRSPLKIQTASCLLTAAAVLGIAIMPFPILGATASPLGTPTLSITPTASPATSPVMAYFGEDVHVRSEERGEWACQPESSGNKDLEETDDLSPRASPSLPFFLQVDAPNDGLPSWTLPTSTPPRRKAKRLDSSTEVFPEASDSVHDSSAVSSTGLNAGFTVYENIASTYSPSSAIASSSSSSGSQSTATASSAQVPIPTAPTSRLPLATAFPQPFDQSLSYSLSTSCVAFLASYLGSEEMIGNSTRPDRVGSCGRPFGLLMSSSSGWAKM